MKKTMIALMAAGLIAAPVCRLVRADEGKTESRSEEKRESPEHQRHEEQEALQRYNKAVANNGKDSAQAKKAWKRYAHEMKEHGHASEIQNGAAAPAQQKS